MSFTNKSALDTIEDSQKSVEFSNTMPTIDLEVIWDDFDICTVTVTITTSDGRSASSTASNNKGNCNAAAAAAEADARMKLFFTPALIK